MPTTTTEVGVKISADDRELKKLAQTIPQAFDKRSVKEFQQASKDVEGQLASLVRKQAELTRQLERVDRGTKAYKDLNKELRGVRREADMVSKSLGQIDRLLQRQEQQQRRARGPGFVAGMGQGLGVAQYIPTGPQMVPRMAGAMVGGALRRGAGAAAAPFAMPGIGGVAQGLSGIPIVGGFLGGALQQAAGAYQAAVGYDRAVLEALPFAGAPPTAAAQQAARARQIARATGKVQAQFGPGLTAARTQRAAAVQAAAGAGGLTFTGGAVPSEAAGARERMAAQGAGGWFLSKFMAETEREQTKRETRDRSSGALSAAAERVKNLEERKRKAMTAARASARGLPRTGLPTLSEGAEFGLGPQQMIGFFSQMMQARGEARDDVSRSAFREAMAAKTRFGVSAQLAGAFGRMGIAGGGGQMGGMDLSTALQTAVAQGLKGSQVTEFLQELISLGQRAEKMGVKFDVREFTRMTAGLRVAGMQGLQAQRIAGGLQQAAMGVGQRGVQGPLDVIMARAAGFDPSQGAEGYARAMNKLAGGMSSEMMNNLLGMITQGAGAGGFGPEMQRLMFRRAMGKMGVQVGPGQASDLIESYRRGVRPDISELIERGERKGARGRLEREALQLVGREAPTARGAARLEAGRIGLGRAAAPWVQAFERNAQQSGQIINQFGKDLQNLSGYVTQAMSAVKRITEGGLEGIVEKIVAKVLGLGG